MYDYCVTFYWDNIKSSSPLTAHSPELQTSCTTFSIITTLYSAIHKHIIIISLFTQNNTDNTVL